MRDAEKEESFSDRDGRASLKGIANLSRVLVKTLLHAGTISQCTAPLYVGRMKELEAER